MQWKMREYDGEALAALVRKAAPGGCVVPGPEGFSADWDERPPPAADDDWPEELVAMFEELPTTEAAREERRVYIRGMLLSQSRHIHSGEFYLASQKDLAILFDYYDREFFLSALTRMLKPYGSGKVSFELSRRLSKSAGKTHRYDRHLYEKGPPGQPSRDVWVSGSFQMAISKVVLFSTFMLDTPAEFVYGRACTDRVDVLMRMVEHELVHLFELLVVGKTSCKRRLFQALASSLFGHRSATHQIVTEHEVERRQAGVKPGDRVRFEGRDRMVEGTVARITRRATVLVESERGARFDDGKRYIRYYVPISMLQRVEDRSADQGSGDVPRRSGKPRPETGLGSEPDPDGSARDDG